jgi:replicative DNA helicase
MEAIKPKFEQPDARELLELYTPAQLLDEWAKACVLDIDNPLTTSFPSFDRVLRNKMRGSLGVYAGYGGTKKSLFALQSCRKSIHNNDKKVKGLYANMEMSAYQFVGRLMNNSFKQDEVPNLLFSTFAERCIVMAQKESGAKVLEYLAELSEQFEKHYGDSLQISQGSGVSVDKIYNTAKHLKEQGTPLDIIAVDGLSMLNGKGFNEMEKYSNNTQRLKEIANEFNVHVAVICHLSKGAKKHDREVMHLIRGSEKISDNMDFSLQFSLIVDESQGSAQAPIYRQDKGWVRLYDKRGSGVIMDKIYDFCNSTLTMSESNEDPKMYETRDEKTWTT